MGALPWIIGGAALGVGILWVRSRAAKGETDTPGTCEALEKLGVPKSLCDIGLPLAQEAGEAIVHAVGGKLPSDVEKWDAENKKLNGEVRIPINSADPTGAFMSQLAMQWSTQGGTHAYGAVDGTVLEFENGCVPLDGAPGFAKCAPGTHKMGTGGGSTAWKFTPDGTATASYKPSYVAPMSGSARIGDEPDDVAHAYDPFTRGGFTGPINTGTTKQPVPFPIPIPSGHVGYVYKGRPFTCPKGSPPALRGASGEVIRDWRTSGPGADATESSDYIPPCGGATWGTRDQLGGTVSGGDLNFENTNVITFGSSSSTENPCVTDPAHFIWDPAGFCRRRAVGE